MTPTLSVIIANYNDARYLGESLEAILRQSFKAKEVFVSDDASTDNSVEVVESFMRRDPSVKLLRSDKNRGTLTAVNRALALATGDYVATLTSDDKILPGLFERSMNLLAEFPQAGLCSALTLIMGANGEDLGPYLTPVVSDSECFIPPEDIFKTFKKFGVWIMTHTVIFKRAALLEAGGFDLDLGGTSDMFLFHAISIRHGVCFIPAPLAMWRKVVTRDRQPAQEAVIADAVARFHALEKRMRAENLFSGEYMDVWKRRGLLVMMDETARRLPFQFDRILQFARSLPDAKLLDRIFVAALLASLSLARWTTRLYVFSQHRGEDRRRIVLRKLKNLFF